MAANFLMRVTEKLVWLIKSSVTLRNPNSIERLPIINSGYIMAVIYGTEEGQSESVTKLKPMDFGRHSVQSTSITFKKQEESITNIMPT